MHWIICPIMGQVDLTSQAVDTFLKQNVEDLNVLVLDNGKDGSEETKNYIEDLDDDRVHYDTPPIESRSVAGAWNFGLKKIFKEGNTHALVCNNDVLLREDTYSLLLKNGGGFVTGVGSNDPGCVYPHYLGPEQTPDNPGISWQDGEWIHLEPSSDPRPHPDFSCYLIRREVYETVGDFDENCKNAFVEDWDYHCRLHLHGIRAISIGVPFYHVGSATINRLAQDKAKEISKYAEENRDYFEKKWGFRGATDAYGEYFKTKPEELQKDEFFSRRM